MKHNINRFNSVAILSALFAAAVAALSGMIAANLPLYDDDLVFANSWGCVHHLICPEEDFNPWQYAMEHRLFVNGRVGDMFTPLLMMLPRWLYGTLYAMGLMLIIMLMMRIARISFRSAPVKAIWLTGFIVVLFPWIDVLYTRAVFLNYFPAVIFTLCSLIFFVSDKEARGWRAAACIAAGFITGCWHELMPVALLPSAILYCTFTRKVTRNQLLVSLSIAAGLAIVISAPSFFHRVNQLDELYVSDRRVILAILYTTMLLAISAASLWLIYLRKGDGKATRQQKAFTWALVLPVVPCSAVMLSSLFETRICLLAVILTTASFFHSLPRRKPGKAVAVATVAVTAVCSVVVLAHLAYVVHDTLKVRRAYESITAQAAANPQVTIYYDLESIVANDNLNLYKTIGRSYINKTHSWEDFSHYTGYRYSFNVLHPALKGVDLAAADTIDAREGVYYYKGRILIDAPCDSTLYIDGTIDVSFADGSRGAYQFIGPYLTDARGNPLIYILPYRPRMPKKKPAAVKVTSLKLHRRIMR